MKDAAIPYTLPEVDDHSFFFIHQHINPALEAQMHRHEAWEVYHVTHGKGLRTTGDTVMPFAEGDVVLIPPSMVHCWEYDRASVDESGEVSYLMIAFSPALISKCAGTFPEIRHKLATCVFPTEAIKFGSKSAAEIRQVLKRMTLLDDVGRLCEMLKLLPVLFGTSDHIFIGKPVKLERDIQRMQQIATYVMAHYVHNVTLAEIASHVGMNRTAFCTFFKRKKGMTFLQFLTNYRLETARELLVTTQKQVSEICFAVGFNDLPHFIRIFKATYGNSPSRYRKLKEQAVGTAKN